MRYEADPPDQDVANTVDGDIQGNVVQAHTVHGGVHVYYDPVRNTPHAIGEPLAATPVAQPAAAPGPRDRSSRDWPARPQAHTESSPADTSATPAMFTRSRWTHAQHTGSVGALAVLAVWVPLCILAALTYEGSKQAFRGDMQNLIVYGVFGSMLVFGVIAMVAGACEDHSILTIGPDTLVIEEKTLRPSANTTMAISWDRLHRVSVLGTASQPTLLAWTENGHPPDPAISEHDQVDSGWKLCDLSKAIHRDFMHRNRDMAKIRAALTYFGGDKYTQP